MHAENMGTDIEEDSA